MNFPINRLKRTYWVLLLNNRLRNPDAVCFFLLEHLNLSILAEQVFGRRKILIQLNCTTFYIFFNWCEMFKIETWKISHIKKILYDIVSGTVPDDVSNSSVLIILGKFWVLMPMKCFRLCLLFVALALDV